MINAFHHIPRPFRFLKEAERVLVSGGVVAMIETANSVLGRWIYKRFHHEPFDEAGPREIAAGHRLSHGNQAMAYIYFERDRLEFEQEFPTLNIELLRYLIPLLYVLSGGLSRPAIAPKFCFRFLLALEACLFPLRNHLGLFCSVVLRKCGNKDVVGVNHSPVET